MKKIIKRVISVIMVLTCVFALAVSTSATQKYVNMHGRASYTCTVEMKNDIKNQYYKWISLYNSGNYPVIFNVKGYGYCTAGPRQQKDIRVGYQNKILSQYKVTIQPFGRASIPNTNWVTVKSNSWAPIK